MIDLKLIKPEILGKSQKGQDAFIKAIAENIPNINKFYVEFGAYNGIDLSNTFYLKHALGWNGLLLDHEYENPNLNLHKHFLTTDNILSIFEKYNVPKDLGFLCIDIDGNDYWLLSKILEKYKPSFLMVEACVRFPSDVSIVQKYNPNNLWDGKSWYGASPLALKKLLNSYNYDLAYIHLDDMIAISSDIKHNILIDDYDIIYNSPNEELYKSHNSPNINMENWINV